MPGFVGRVDGISVSMDINACYRDYPEIIRTNLLNGWKSVDKPDVPTNPSEYGTISVSRAKLEGLRDDLAAALNSVTRILGTDKI